MPSRGPVVVLIGVAFVLFLLLATISNPGHSEEKEIRAGGTAATNEARPTTNAAPPDFIPTVIHEDEKAAMPQRSQPIVTTPGPFEGYKQPQKQKGERNAIAGRHNPVQVVTHAKGGEVVDTAVSVEELAIGDEDDQGYAGLAWQTDSELEEDILREEEEGREPNAEEIYCERLRKILAEEEAHYLSKEQWRRYNHTALASFPRSGNTWARIVLQEMTGIVSGSIYEDKIAPEPLHRIPGTEDVFVVKTHQSAMSFEVRESAMAVSSKETSSFDAVILLVRNPFDAVMSDLNHSFSHTFSGTLEHLTSQMKSHAQDRFRDWQESVRYWMKQYTGSGLPFLLIRYEDMIADPKRNFSDMLQFLGSAVDNEKIDCILDATSCERHPESCRLGTVGSSMKIWDRRMVEEQALLLEEELELLGYDISFTDSLPGVTVLPMGEGRQESSSAAWAEEDVRECLQRVQPNVLFVLSDDQRKDSVGYENRLIRTPVLDSLARSGVTYLNAHSSSPFCSPSRVAILTGKREQRNGVWSGKLQTDLAWPRVLDELGVRTSMSGKFHTDLGGRISHMGFTSYSGVFNGGMHDYHSIAVESSKDGSKAQTVRHSPTQAFTDAAIEEISTALDAKQRFAHWLCFTAPHDPRVPDPISYREEYQRTGVTLQEDWTPEPLFDPGTVMTIRQELLFPRPLQREEWAGKEVPGYYGLITQMDEHIGRVVSFLKEREQFNNTLIIFASDNGLMMGSHGLVAKQYMYEESIRVPMFITGPCVAKGKVSRAMVDILDVYPTLLDAFGEKSSLYDIDGKSLLQTFHPTPVTDLEFRDELLCSYRNSFVAVKTNRWKLVHNLLVDKVELFDLEEDPQELNDLAGAVGHAGIQQQLEERMAALLQDIHDKM